MSGMMGDGRRGGGLAGGLSGGLKMAAVALLVHQLMKHARSQQAGAPAGGNIAGSGGLGNVLGGLFNGDRAAPGAPAGQAGQPGGLGGLLAGGLGGLLSGLGGMLGGLRRHGLSQEVDSWVTTGPNRQVSGQQLEQVFDPGELDEIARRAGTDRASLLEAVSQVLPRFVDAATPQGHLPVDERGAGTELSSLLNSLADSDRAPRRGPDPGAGI